MTKAELDKRAQAARRALKAFASKASEDLETSIADLIADIGHLCAAEQIDFLAALSNGVRHWAVERINPDSTRPGPSVDVTISVQGLAPRSKPEARRSARPKRSRRPRDGPGGK